MQTYKTVVETKPAILDAHVNARLKQGWKLYGNPYTVMKAPEGSIHGSVLHYCQAVVLTHKKTDKVK